MGAIANSSTCLSGNVLLLNAHYAALRVISVRRAFTLLFTGHRSQAGCGSGARRRWAVRFLRL